jgi:hypothetical protein
LRQRLHRRLAAWISITKHRGTEACTSKNN